MFTTKSIVINTAGVGSRLGFGYPKSLLEIGGKPLIYHHLDATRQYKDVRVVVGHQAEKVIRMVRAYRNDVLFVFNHEYERTNTLASLSLGCRHAAKRVVSLDGDLLVHPEDLRIFLRSPDECIGYTETYTEEPVYTHIVSDEKTYVSWFSRKRKTPYEWSGLVQVDTQKIQLTHEKQHVFEVLKHYMPLKAKHIRCVEIDTPKDYEYALGWAAKHLHKGAYENIT